MPAPASYEFSSKPRPVKPRPKFRQDAVGNTSNAETRQEPFFPVNIHHDPRVARGNTFAGDRPHDVPPAEPRPKTAAKPRRTLGRGRSRGSSSSFFENTASQPFLRQELDLSSYLIEPGEGGDRPEQEVETQTDAFEERPQTPDFVPKKTGVDASTQIEVSDKLFDFEAEVQPMLAVLVGKTLEQARIEVEREHELECIRGAAAELIRRREEEARQVLEMKQAAVEAEREKEELRRRRREEAARRRVAREKVACLQLVRQVLPLSLERALAQLSQKSWVTPSIHQIKNDFLPWLFERVAADADQRAGARDTLDGLLASAEDAAEAARVQRIEARRWEAEARREAAEAARAREIGLFVPAELVRGDGGEGERLGPVAVRGGDTVEAAEGRVAEWLAGEGGVEDVAVPERGFLGGYLRAARRRGGSPRLGKDSLLLELQERLGGASDEVLLRATFEALP